VITIIEAIYNSTLQKEKLEKKVKTVLQTGLLKTPFLSSTALYITVVNTRNKMMITI
jgi:hypothetical protein